MSFLVMFNIYCHVKELKQFIFMFYATVVENLVQERL